MRDYKYRVWDTKEKKFLYGKSGFSMYGEIVVLGQWGADVWKSIREDEADRYILLQYTGLKDRNDIEIYDGDIYKTVYDYDASPDKRYKVMYKSGSWVGGNDTYSPLAWDFEEGEISEDDSFVNENLEVVGNIYENGDLLNGSK
jgi:uncharacterized phage protein (TIGR01671 family)